MLTIIISKLMYLGPGLGGGIITAIVGVIGAFFLGLFAILWYPMKKLIAKMKKKDTTTVATTLTDADNAPNNAPNTEK